MALFLNVANVLHVFDIGPPLDECGKHIRIRPEMTDGFLSCVSHTPLYHTYRRKTGASSDTHAYIGILRTRDARLSLVLWMQKR